MTLSCQGATLDVTIHAIGVTNQGPNRDGGTAILGCSLPPPSFVAPGLSPAAFFVRARYRRFRAAAGISCPSFRGRWDSHSWLSSAASELRSAGLKPGSFFLPFSSVFVPARLLRPGWFCGTKTSACAVEESLFALRRLGLREELGALRSPGHSRSACVAVSSSAGIKKGEEKNPVFHAGKG